MTVIAIMILAMITALSSPQSVQDHVWQVGQWTIIDAADRCILGKEIDQNGGTIATLVARPERASYLALRNQRWSIEDQAQYEITYLIDDTLWRGMAIGTRSKDDAYGAISVNVDNEFISSFAAGQFFTVFRGEKLIAGFDLSNSGAAVRQLRKCVEIVQRRVSLETRRSKLESDIKIARKSVEDLIADDPFGDPEVPSPNGHVPPTPQPIGATNNWITIYDYPTAAFDHRLQGETGFRLDIDSSGLVTGCTIIKSSGSDSLDQTTCTILLRRARFSPARGADGKAIASSWESSFYWRPPDRD
ncbi:MAG: energy transducer TonB [Pseudomonadota bacterium]